MDKAHERRFEFLGLAILLTVWGGTGHLTDRSGWVDALYGPDFTIRHAPEGGVVAEAGLQVGDTVVAVEGVPVGELGMYSRWPRSLSRRPGETLRVTARRGGQSVTGTVVVRQRPPSIWVGRWVLLLFTQTFLWLGVWVLFTTPTLHAGRLALLGIVAGLATPGPDLGSLNGLRDHLEVAGQVLFLILLVHFLLLFPRAKGPARRRWIGLMYLPWVVLLVAQAVELATHPRLYHVFGAYLGILFLGYILAAGLTVIDTAVTLPANEHARSGMGLMLGGWAVALFPNLLVVLGWAVPPGWQIPGSRWFPLFLLAVPVGMALAVRREARDAEAGPAAPATPG